MTRPPTFLRRSTALLGWALAALVLTGASLTVTASRALAQEKRVEIRTVETSSPPVLFVDGVLHEGDLEALNSLDVYALDLYNGDEARETFGVDHAMEIVTRAEAQRRGLPAKAGSVTTRFEGAASGAGGEFKILLDEETPSADGSRVRIRERVVGGEDAAHLTDEDVETGGDVQIRTRRSPEAELRALGINPEDVETIDVRVENGQRTTTVRLVGGEVREFVGEALGMVRLGGDEAKAAGGAPTAPSPFADVSTDPNPATDMLRISFALAADAEVRLRIYDLSGRELTEDAYGLRAGPQSVEVDLSAFPAGTYVYRLDAPGAEGHSGRLTVAR